MFYKVIYNRKVIDVLDNLLYLKYKPKHNRMVLCGENDAQAIISSDGNRIWHVKGWYNVPTGEYDTVTLEKIDRYEYEKLKSLDCGTKEDIMDEFTRLLISGDPSLLIASLKRLYSRQEINENMVIRVCNEYKIAEEYIQEILNAKVG